MAIYRHIYTKIWEDTLVAEKMDSDDKLFFMYLLTNRNTTQIGVYTLTVRQAAFELNYSSEKVKELINKFENDLGLIVYSPETLEVAIKNWGKYNLNKGGKPIIDCIVKELKEVKNKELIKIVSEKIEKDCIKEIFNSFYDGSFTNRGEKEKEKIKIKIKNKKENTIEEVDKSNRFKNLYYEEGQSRYNISEIEKNIQNKFKMNIQEKVNNGEEFLHNIHKNKL